MDIALDLLEPLHAIARRALQLERFNLAVFLVKLQGIGNIAFVTGHRLGQRHRVFHGQFCARADTEVSGVCSIADENDIFVMPLFTQYAGKFQPYRRTTQMLGVGDEGIAIETFGEQLFAQGDRFLLLHLVDAAP